MATDDIGLWCELGTANADLRPALFLDRDGVIVVDTNYLGRAQDVRMIDGVAVAIARCNVAQIPVVVVTNQAGIGRGFYDWNGFAAVQAEISAALSVARAHLDGVLACGYHGEGLGPLRIADHPWRKPNPGMLLAAAKGMNIDLAGSWIVGDKAHDLASGAAAGLAGGTLVSADEGERQLAGRLANARFLVEMAADPADALAKVIESGRLVQRADS